VATITPVDPRQANGVAVATTAASGGGDVIPMQPDKTYLVRINNGGGAPITVDIDDPASGSGGTPEYNDVSVTNGTSRVFAFKRPLFGKVPSADVALAYSAVTSVTVEAYGPLD
jgi:hypothetical protein